MARGMMHRLINIADGDQLRLMNVAEASPDVAILESHLPHLCNDLRQLARSIGGTGKTKVQNARSASKKIAELTLRASPPTVDRFGNIEAAYEFADDALKQGREKHRSGFQAHSSKCHHWQRWKTTLLGSECFRGKRSIRNSRRECALIYKRVY